MTTTDVLNWFNDMKISMNAFRLNREDHQIDLDGNFNQWQNSGYAPQFLAPLDSTIRAWCIYHNLPFPHGYNNQ